MVTKSLYIVTILGQLPFMLFTEIAQTWVAQRDSVNTAIIHSYSIDISCENQLSGLGGSTLFFIFLLSCSSSFIGSCAPLLLIPCARLLVPHVLIFGGFGACVLCSCNDRSLVYFPLLNSF